MEQRIDAQAGMYRAAMDIDRIRMDESVRILNDAAFAQVEKQVRGQLGSYPLRRPSNISGSRKADIIKTSSY